MTKYKTMTEALLQEMEASELSFKKLGELSGLKRQALMRFYDGKQSLRLDLADKLAEFFGLEIVKRTRK